MKDSKELLNIICPLCNYKMPISYSKDSEANCIFVRCKGRTCKQIFEIKIKNGKQVNL